MPSAPANNPPDIIRGGDVSEDDRHNIEVSGEFFSGPLPPPAVLRQYNEIQPDFAERLLRLTETEAEHRRQVTTRAQRDDAIETVLGQVFALIVSLAAFGTAAWLGFLGHPAAASVIGGSAIVGLVGAFIAGRQHTASQNKPPIH